MQDNCPPPLKAFPPEAKHILPWTSWSAPLLLKLLHRVGPDSVLKGRGYAQKGSWQFDRGICLYSVICTSIFYVFAFLFLFVVFYKYLRTTSGFKVQLEAWKSTVLPQRVRPAQPVVSLLYPTPLCGHLVHMAAAFSAINASMCP